MGATVTRAGLAVFRKTERYLPILAAGPRNNRVASRRGWQDSKAPARLGHVPPRLGSCAISADASGEPVGSTRSLSPQRAAIAARRDPETSTENRSHVALRGKSAVIGDLGKRHVGRDQHFADALAPTIEYVLVRGLARGRLECPRQLPDRQPDGARQIDELEGLCQRGFDVVRDPTQACGVQSRRRRLRSHVGLCSSQKSSRKREHSMIDCERSERTGLNGMLPKPQAQVSQTRVFERVVAKRTQGKGERRALHTEPASDIDERSTDEQNIMLANLMIGRRARYRIQVDTPDLSGRIASALPEIDAHGRTAAEGDSKRQRVRSGIDGMAVCLSHTEKIHGNGTGLPMLLRECAVGLVTTIRLGKARGTLGSAIASRSHGPGQPRDWVFAVRFGAQARRACRSASAWERGPGGAIAVNLPSMMRPLFQITAVCFLDCWSTSMRANDWQNDDGDGMRSSDGLTGQALGRFGPAATSISRSRPSAGTPRTISLPQKHGSSTRGSRDKSRGSPSQSGERGEGACVFLGAPWIVSGSTEDGR